MGRQIRSKYYTIAHTYIQQIHYKLPSNKIEPFERMRSLGLRNVTATCSYI